MSNFSRTRTSDLRGNDLPRLRNTLVELRLSTVTHENDSSLPAISPRRDPDVVGRFMDLYNTHRGAIFGYVLALTADRAVAEEILQDTSLLLWREFDQFVPGTHFMAWARQIALNRVRDARRRARRVPLPMEDGALQQIADERSQMDAHLEQRWDQLQHCLTRLRDEDQQLVDTYYGHGATAKDVATRTGRSEAAIRKAIKRIRKALFACVDDRRPGDVSA